MTPRDSCSNLVVGLPEACRVQPCVVDEREALPHRRMTFVERELRAHADRDCLTSEFMRSCRGELAQGDDTVPRAGQGGAIQIEREAASRGATPIPVPAGSTSCRVLPDRRQWNSGPSTSMALRIGPRLDSRSRSGQACYGRWCRDPSDHANTGVGVSAPQPRPDAIPPR